ncbi:PAS domain-containing protein [Nitrogeniibacter mangrovi]|uniref:histidine kinase n=1 Tax=Nitrogeniibacter mangrovi TaxID=2016596 RepID=A0A6C1B3N9_9RHOO|nr:PAS domain-containing sensor histidine kinase [Nitrogeniibacter mangrovi]QID17465.1 PAS domain-containing protein [Nitrogeniibacter mangrovi]
MASPATYVLVPIDSVRPVEGFDGRWCGHVTLPGETSLQTVLIDRREGEYVALRPSCAFNGWRTVACRQNASDERICGAQYPETLPPALPVARIGQDFFLAIDTAQDDAFSERQRLADELTALREANRALEEQVSTVSRAMDEIISELSDRSRQLQARGREQERLGLFVQRVMDTMDSPLIVLDRFGRIAQLNPAACRLFRCAEDALVGEAADVLLSAADKRELQSGQSAVPDGLLLFRTTISRRGLAVELSLGGRRAEGVAAAKVFLVRGTPLYDGAGKLEGVVIVATDVTRLRERERALEESEQRFRDYSSMSTSLTWQTDATLAFVPVEKNDPYFEPLFKGRTPIDLALPEERESSVWQTCVALMARREPVRDLEVRIATAEGIKWYAINGIPMVADGVFCGYRGVAKDLTKRRHMEDELRRHRDHLSELVHEQTADLIAAKEAAEHANRMKSEFLSNISHELRTPLHSIMSFSKLGASKARDPDKADKVVGYFERIHVSGTRLTRLVDDLLNLAKFEAGKVVLDVRPTVLEGVIGEVAATLEALLVSRRQQLAVSNGLHGQPVRIDPDRFAQVVLNLLGNASKFSPAGSTIRLALDTARFANGRAAFRLEVADEGPGIPADELEHVFDKFAQSSRTKTGAGGTGLGLAICRQIVLAHQGSIRAANREDGHGTVFEVLMPLQMVADAQTA